MRPSPRRLADLTPLRERRAVRLRPTYVGVAAAVCILAVTMVDSLTTLLGYPPAPARYDPAIGGALFAGFLVGRVWTMAAKAIRSSHVELHDL